MSDAQPRTPESLPPIPADEQAGALSAKLNWLRAGVLGANDGIISTAGLVMGVAGATTDTSALLVAGTAGLVAGALSMAGGEYVSVSSQRDTEIAELRHEAQEIAEDPEGELRQLAGIYERKGIPADVAHEVAVALTERDALAAHAESELGISPDVRADPWQAAGASAIAFSLGALVPLLVMVLSPAAHRVLLTLGAVVLALVLTGLTSATLGGSGRARPIARNVVVGLLGMGLTYLVGTVVGG